MSWRHSKNTSQFYPVQSAHASLQVNAPHPNVFRIENRTAQLAEHLCGCFLFWPWDAYSGRFPHLLFPCGSPGVTSIGFSRITSVVIVFMPILEHPPLDLEL